MAAKNKNSNKDNKKSISYVKIVLFLVLTISGGFSGLLFDKFDIKEKIIDLRYKIYNYFTSEPLKQYTAKDNQNIIVKFFLKVIVQKISNSK